MRKRTEIPANPTLLAGQMKWKVGEFKSGFPVSTFAHGRRGVKRSAAADPAAAATPSPIELLGLLVLLHLFGG
jgi:hypothetical protein